MDRDLAGLIGLLKLASLINRPMLLEVAGPLNLSLNDLRLVMRLGGEGAIASHELALDLGMHPMAVSRSVSILRDLKAVIETRDPTNRRRKILSLSPEGLRLFSTIMPATALVANKLFADLTPSERDNGDSSLIALVNRLTHWQA